MKERLGLTEMRKAANRMNFGEVRVSVSTTPCVCLIELSNPSCLTAQPPLCMLYRTF